MILRIASTPLDDVEFLARSEHRVTVLDALADRPRSLADLEGRVALSDIISETRMPESIRSDADLWAACIGGAEQVDD